MISSRQLEYFRAVARQLHFTRAAESLHVAQPALSQQIRKLERQLGVDLFERDRHRVRLTAAGTALLGHAERIVADLGAVEDEMLGWGRGLRGRLRLGMARGLAVGLARLLAGFCAEYPGVDVELREESNAAMIADLREGLLDVATLAVGDPADRRLASRPLGVEPLVLITATDSPLAARPRLPMAQLDGVDLVLYSEGSAVREVVAAAAAAAGAEPRVRFQTREYATARVLVSEGLAVAVLPRSVALEPGPAVRVVALDPEPSWHSSLAWRAGYRPGPALAAFLDYAEAHRDVFTSLEQR